jgi:hypothetical protein
MKNRQRVIWLVLLLAAGFLFPAAPALANDGPPGDEGVIIWNEDYTLEEGEELVGNLVVFNGDVTLEADSHVEGSVVIWNGNIEVDGTVTQDVVVSGGNIHLGEAAWVGGSVVCSWNCDLDQEEGAHVEGGYTEGDPLSGFRYEGENGISVPVLPNPPFIELPTLGERSLSFPGRALNTALKFIRSVTTILVVAAVAGLVALIWPEPTAQVGRVAVEAPWHSLGIGVVTAGAATVFVIVLALTICMSPIAALAALALGAAALFGWIAVGAVVGKRLMQALNAREITPLWAAGLGTLLITLTGVGLSAAFCLAPLGWLLVVAVGCLGLGAVVLTRFGTMAYVPPAASRPSGPTPPAAVLVEKEEAAGPEPSQDEIAEPQEPEPAEAETGDGQEEEMAQGDGS